MNTFWLKIAALAVVVVLAIVLIGVFTSSEKPEPLSKLTAEPVDKPAKDFYEQVEKDKEKFLTPPKPPEQQAKTSAEEPVKQQPVASSRGEVQDQNQPAENQTSPKPVRPAAKPTQLYFRPLSEIDRIEAERLLNVAVPGRSIGRLPMASGAGIKLMVDTCRQIISKWPDSWYAYNAKKMLADVPVRFRERYKITPEEMDTSEFTKQRPGTEPFKGTDGSRRNLFK